MGKDQRYTSKYAMKKNKINIYLQEMIENYRNYNAHRTVWPQ